MAFACDAFTDSFAAANFTRRNYVTDELGGI